MPIEQLAFLCIAIAIIAFLYSSVGHAGASGYIAVMTLFGLAPLGIKPAALELTIAGSKLTFTRVVAFPTAPIYGSITASPKLPTQTYEN